MWRGRNQEEIQGRVSKELLPYVGTYADMLMEGITDTKYKLGLFDRCF